MKIEMEHIDKIIGLVRQRFPGWESVKDERFGKEEIGYKREAVSLMNQLLSQKEIDRLISTQEHDEVINRLDKVGHKTNLLWLSVPKSGDLRILYHETLDKPAFCKAMRDLLYGEGESHHRLDKFSGYLKERGLPNNWPFPTYYLFLGHPDTEFFVRPKVTKWLLQLIRNSDSFTSTPSSTSYSEIKSICSELKQQLSRYGTSDMIDVQSIIWVASSVWLEYQDSTVKPERKELLDNLFDEFTRSYFISDEGMRHRARYDQSRQDASKNFQLILQTEQKGEDITDLVLLKLLPYSDTEANRSKGAFIPVAPSITGDLRGWFEGAGWAKREDWPKIAKAILSFVKHAHKEPGDIEAACKRFTDLEYAKGLQTGMMSPILNALGPAEFRIINNKSRRVINYFTQSAFRQSLVDYPVANRMVEKIVADLAGKMSDLERDGLSDYDIFDMFCNWLVAIKRYNFRKVKYWKIAPGENAWNWQACRDGNFIAIGWDDMGDLSGLSKEEFLERWRQADKTGNEWTRTAINQLWNFRNLEEGDRIVANQGTTRVLGLGIVAGDYYFVPDIKHGQRVPVEWYDLEQREVRKEGWRRTLVKLSEEEFQEIGGTVGSDFRDKEKKAFTLKTFEWLAALHDKPTQEFYRANYDEFKSHVEEPIQRIMKQVAERLPRPMREALETEKNIFGRIPKNDWGRGGAWDFYWGAFYPKGGKRISDAQLFVGVHPEYFHFGFSIGEYGSDQRARFLKNCHDNASGLAQLLRDNLPKGLEYSGSSEDRTARRHTVLGDFAEWIKDPAKTGLTVGMKLDHLSAVKLAEEELVNQISETFMGLFPLMILAIHDEPMQKIYEYLGPEPPSEQPEYSLAQFAQETGFNEKEISRWVRAIARKGQIIFYGPPGTGKTFLAERLARHLIGGGDGFMDVLQFHPAYAYEDFIQGIRPRSRADGGLEYPMAEGRFMAFCKRARNVKGKCVLILDEINRANLSRVFGELMYLLEYRNANIPLAAGGEFQIPPNVHIIGTMNTADRSIALVDHALRRRFAFIPLHPNSEILRIFHEDTEFDPLGLINVLKRINTHIADPHYEIGITFFLRKDIQDQIADVWRMEIEPYLEEFFYDQRNKVDEFRWEQVQRDILLEADE